MLKGLDISIVKFSQVGKLNIRFRLDSEFFRKEYLQIESTLEAANHKRLFDVGYELIHPTEIKREYVEENGLWFFRTQNIRPLKIDQSNEVFISPEDALNLKRNLINKYDIVITRTGANFGQTAIYNLDKVAVGSSHTLILRNKYFNQSYLAVFFNTSYGRKLINKGMYGGSQPEIAPYYLLNIPIPDLEKDFQVLIETILIQSEKTIQLSKTLYSDSEDLLLKELDLKNLKNHGQSINVKSFSSSFAKTGRLDAEYYQPKYDKLEKGIKSSGLEFKYVKEFRLSNFRGLQPIYSENGKLDIINSKHILDDHLDYENFETADIEYWDIYSKAQVYSGDILTYTTGANIGRTNIYSSTKKALASNHVNILRIKDENPYYISFVINSIVGRLQTEKYSAGSAQAELYPKDIDEFLIPILSKDLQNLIIDNVSNSLSLKRQSQQLIEIAKKAVEMAIEKGEKAATDYINLNLKNG